MTQTPTRQWLLPCLLLSLIACHPAPGWAQSSGGSSGGGGSAFGSGPSADAPRRAPDGASEVRWLYQRGALTQAAICDAVAALRARQPAHPTAVARAEALLKEQHIDCPRVAQKP
jgi:hypothetical protein